MTVFTNDRFRALDQDATRADRRPLSFWLFVLLCFFSAILGRFSYMIRPFDSDGSMFIFMGRVITEGGRFCHDLCDNKFPTVGLMTSVPWRMFGPNWCQYILLETALSMFMAWLIARSAARHFGAHAIIPTLLFAIVYLNMNFVVFGGFQLETMQAFFAVLAAGAALELIAGNDLRDAFVIGLCGGCAAMLKPTGLAVIGAIGLTLCIFNRHRPKQLLAQLATIGGGAMLPAAVVLTYLIRADNLRDMPDLWRQIATYAKNSSWDVWDLSKPITVGVFGGFPIFVRYVIFRRSKDKITVRFDKPAVAFVVIWLIAEAAGIVAQRRMYAYHFMVLIPPVALLYGMLPRRDRLAPMVAALTPMALFSVYGASLVIGLTYTGTFRLAASDYIAARTVPTDAVWMDDNARLLLETGLRPGTRYPITFLFANYDGAGLEYGATILSDFARTQPRYILIPADFEKYLKHQCHEILELNRFPIRSENYCQAWRAIRSYAQANYTHETRIGDQDVYRRIAR